MKINLTAYLFLALFSCGDLEEKGAIREDHRRDSLSKIDSLHLLNMFDFSLKNGVRYAWDTLDYRYSLDYEKVLTSGNQIVFHYKIIDVFRKNNLIYSVIRTGEDPDEISFLFTLEISEKDVETMQRSKLIDEDGEGDAPLLVNITNIRKLSIFLGAEKSGSCEVIEGEVENNVSCEIGVFNSTSFTGSGKIISIQEM